MALDEISATKGDTYVTSAVKLIKDNPEAKEDFSNKGNAYILHKHFVSHNNSCLQPKLHLDFAYRFISDLICINRDLSSTKDYTLMELYKIVKDDKEQVRIKVEASKLLASEWRREQEMKRSS